MNKATQGRLTPASEPSETWTNEHRNTVDRWCGFTISGSGYKDDRLYRDFGACSQENGWFQFDTHQDASYFGVWVNPEKRLILTYCEGDLYLTRCETAESYKDELEDAANVYGGPPPFAISIDDDGKVTHHYDKRPMTQEGGDNDGTS